MRQAFPAHCLGKSGADPAISTKGPVNGSRQAPRQIFLKHETRTGVIKFEGHDSGRVVNLTLVHRRFLSLMKLRGVHRLRTKFCESCRSYAKTSVQSGRNRVMLFSYTTEADLS
jgi:hypothetical protein